MHHKNRSGYVLPAVLIVALIALLFGFGRLLLFRYQCEIRFDRQREIDRKLAVRSALRWLENQYPPPLPSITNEFVYIDSNGRSIDVTVRPQPSIYPAPDRDDHFKISDCSSIEDVPSHVSVESTHPDMAPTSINGVNQPYDLRIGSADRGVSSGEVGRIFIDMEGLGSWLNDTYGRRYWVEPQNVNAAGADITRFCLTPIEESFADNSAAIWVEQTQNASSISVLLKTRDEQGNVSILATNDVEENEYSRGIQLAGGMISFFHWYEPGGSPFGEYVFHGSYDLPEDVISSFENRDVRLTLEVEAHGTADSDNSFRWIRVDPAYEFDVLLEWDSRIFAGRTQEVATVVHLKPKRGRGDDGKAFTYDTHDVGQE
jgi:hypothetical protein